MPTEFCIHFSFLPCMRLKNVGEKKPVASFGYASSSILKAKLFNSERINFIVIKLSTY
jgi:hypothetical protein